MRRLLVLDAYAPEGRAAVRAAGGTEAGALYERMLRRLRYALFDHILRFPLRRFRRVKAAEMATMIKDEVEPLGGFIGEAIITPLFLGGQALTAMAFILYQHVALGLVALAVVLVQAVVIPRLRRRLLVLGRERQLTARALAGRIAECVDGIAEIHANDTSNYERAEISARLARIFRIRFELYQRKFLVKFLNNFLSQVTPFLFYTLGGYLVIVGRLDIGALVAVIAAYKDLPGPVKEIIDWDQQRLDVEIKYGQVMEVFTAEEVLPPELQAPGEAPQLPRGGRLKLSGVTLVDDGGARLVDGVAFEAPLDEHIALLGRSSAGPSELAQLIARLMAPTTRTITGPTAPTSNVSCGLMRTITTSNARIAIASRRTITIAVETASAICSVLYVSLEMRTPEDP